jgi:hypothetical protein
MSGRVWVLTPSLTLTALKMQFVRRLRMLAGHSTSRHGKCTWEMAAMPWLSWRTSPRRIEDVRLFLWIQDTDLLNRVQLYVFIAVYNKCVILLSKWVTLNAAPFIWCIFLLVEPLLYLCEYRAFVLFIVYYIYVNTVHLYCLLLFVPCAFVGANSNITNNKH